VSIRANQQGFIDAYHVDGYQAENDVPYSRHLLYDIRLVIDLEAGVYDAWVTPPDGTETMIANRYAFRAVAPEMNDLGRVAIRSYNDHDIALIGHTLVGDEPPCVTDAECPDACEGDACEDSAPPDGGRCEPAACPDPDDASGGGCTATGLGNGNPWLVLLGLVIAVLLRRRLAVSS
jgi:unsaturated chondroitin disaccharide hydrolase